MGTFSIEGFAEAAKQAMDAADDRQTGLKQILEKAMQDNEPSDIISVLDAAIPEGASIGEMIVHLSPELTMLYGRIPPRFQSGIHNHTVFACIAQLTGHETSHVYKKSPEDGSISFTQSLTAKAGEVTSLPADAIHHIENPDEEMCSALHCYGGDFSAVMGDRSLWTFDGYEEIPFSFEALLKESAKAMKQSNNEVGLKALAAAVPAAAPMIESL